jgi:aminoglycoside 6-adenylyltransferase
MLEWHARLVYEPNSDTWYEGRFVEAWADPDALAALPKSFAAYNQDDLRRALLATITLYDRLASETAAVLRVQYPLSKHDDLRAWLEELLER